MANNRPRGGRQAGTANYTPDELDAMLDMVRSLKPKGAADWEALDLSWSEVAVSKNWPLRPPMSVKRKYEKLANVRKPTGLIKIYTYNLYTFLFLCAPHLGDPDCPEIVQKAEYIRVELER